MSFEVSILGSSSATPTVDRHPSAQYLNVREHHMLVDCGEGTQIQMLHYRLKYNRLSHIFISHLHADHYLGLAALIYTMNFHHREEVLHIYGPEGLKEILDMHFRISGTELRFHIQHHVTTNTGKELLLENDQLLVYSFPLRHRIATCGFLFREKITQRKLNAERCEFYNIPYQFFDQIKSGEDFVLPDGTLLKNEELTREPAPARAYAYCSDTIYNEDILEHIHGVDLLYHESTFLHELKERAAETFHTTARQAALIARKAEVKRLIIGHFSARYNNLQELLNEATEVFGNTELATEGRTFFV